MRHGLVMLPDEPWSTTGPRFTRAEELGFDHAWTYDHLVWGGLPDAPWRGALPILTAAALVTSSIRLGTLVSSPNFRHPYPFLRDVQALDDISDGRLLLGVGTGGDRDSRILGEELPLKRRVARFHESTRLLHSLMTTDHVHHHGTFYSAVDARTLPVAGTVPLVVAANGPKSLALAAELGTGWVTTGPPVETVQEWWTAVAGLSRRLDDALEQTGRSLDRYLSLDASPQFSLESVGVFEDMTGRAAELGFTDVISHYPRGGDPYRGDPAVLERLDLPSRA